MMSALLFTHPLSATLMIALPVILGAFLIRKYRLGWGIWWVGAFTFILSQVGHIPFNIAVDIMFERGWLPTPPAEWALVFSAVFLGLSAGLWEEWFRWIAYRWWVPNARTWKSGVILGAGHGGVEAILIGILSLVTFVNILVLRNQDLNLMVPADKLQIAKAQLEAYWSLPWYYPFLGPIERLFTIPFHITASVLVLQAFIRGKIRWVWLAIAWHAILDAVVAVYLPSIWRSYPWQPYAIEGIMGITALLNLLVVFLLKSDEPAPLITSPPSGGQVQLTSLPPPEVTQENLDNSKFTE